MSLQKRVVARYLEALSRPSAKGSPAKEALSNAWDQWDEAMKDSGFLDSLSVVYDELEGTPYVRLAKSISNGLTRAERQTHSWRSAFNYWLEGRDIDINKMVSDLQKTVQNLQVTQRNLSKLEGIRKFPEVWKVEQRDFEKFSSAIDASLQGFSAAIKLLKAGRY